MGLSCHAWPRLKKSKSCLVLSFIFLAKWGGAEQSPPRTAGGKREFRKLHYYKAGAWSFRLLLLTLAKGSRATLKKMSLSSLFFQLLCSCPVASELPDIPTEACPENLGQIQKLAFQRIYSSGSTKNKFTISSANPNLLASWTALTGASDGTKVTISPFIANPTSEAGAPREYGGGNATLGGIPIILGAEPTTFSCELHSAKQTIVKALKDYMCETLGVYFIDESGKIIGLADDNSSATEFYPIPVRQFFVGDKTFGGFESVDMNTIQFSMLANWSNELYVVTPSDFDALTELV